jgi:hypothetical protein
VQERALGIQKWCAGKTWGEQKVKQKKRGTGPGRAGFGVAPGEIPAWFVPGQFQMRHNRVWRFYIYIFGIFRLLQEVDSISPDFWS